jgi:hypothetical protein
MDLGKGGCVDRLNTDPVKKALKYQSLIRENNNWWWYTWVNGDVSFKKKEGESR